MVNKLAFYLVLVTLAIFVWPTAWCPAATDDSRREHTTYFRDTPYELNVYKIHGRKDGPTMMIIGGIQGDEPGGFLSADLYTDMALKQGNLIVVPRANFYSILLFSRGPGGDMNRKFGRHIPGDFDGQIVEVLERLIGESDILLNLHDGSGYYRPTYVNEQANPSKYGQSVIADAEEYTSPRTGKKIELGSMARKVIATINSEIENPLYHFHFMNTRTKEVDSPYSEQRTSATYFALTSYGIPAFGIETSKSLPSIEMKVHQHNLAINAFMEIFGLIPEQPRIYLEVPKLRYMIIAVNDHMPVAVADGQTLTINPADNIEVIHVEANYERGLSVDIQGVGTMNDFRQPFVITKPTFIVAQKDHIKFGRVSIILRPSGTPAGPPIVQTASADCCPCSADKTKPAVTVASASAATAASMPATSAVTPGSSAATTAPAPRPGPFRVKNFLIEVEGQQQQVAEGGRLEIIEGDHLKIVDVTYDGSWPGKDVVVNFRGFVPAAATKSGEDRGFEINTAKSLIASYSISKKEKIFEIAVEQGHKTLALMTVRLNRPRLEYLVFRRNGGPDVRLNDGQSLGLKPGDHVQVVELKTSVPANQRVQCQVQGAAVKTSDSKTLPAFQMGPKGPVTLSVTRAGLTLGKVVLTAG